jgi:hypothetical protein
MERCTDAVVEERNAEIVGRIFNDEELVILLVLEVR